MLTKISSNHKDTQLIMNHGLMLDDDKLEILAVRRKVYYDLLESVDDKQMVRKVFTSQNYALRGHFLTYTCNRKTNFGTSTTKKDRQWGLENTLSHFL